MADIFISYAREDRAVAALLASALERRGWSVWWDRIIPPGKTFDEVIEMELASARCAIVLWSKTAVLSRWVRDEAQAAINAHKLLPAILDGVEPPMGFRRIQAADLAGWRGDDVHSGWQDLRDAADDMLALSHGERVESAQNLEPPQSTHAYSTTKPPDAKKITGPPLWARHVITLLCGYIPLGFDTFILRYIVVILIPLAVSVALFCIWMPASVTTAERWRLCSRHAMLYCLGVIGIFSAAILIETIDYSHADKRYYAILALFAPIAAAAWWLMSRPRRSRERQ